MTERVGDIWEWHHERKWIVITTNIGWKNDGCCPMGAGIAAQAAELFSDLPEWYGTRCRKYKSDTATCLYKPAQFILFPTKPLNVATPWLSWKQNSDLSLIKRSAIQLQKLSEIMQEQKLVFGEIALPLVGCQNGKLSRKDVVPILKAYLDDNFVLVERN